MKAPDKIYVAAQYHPNEKSITYYASSEKTGHPHEELFIRKDVLLEWAKEMKFYATNDGARAYENMIDKINSL